MIGAAGAAVVGAGAGAAVVGGAVVGGAVTGAVRSTPHVDLAYWVTVAAADAES